MAPRPTTQRVADTRRLLETEQDAWVASASADGAPHLVPLSYWWDGAALIVSTAATSVTAHNLARGEQVRLAVGPTRDVVMIVGTASVSPAADDPETADRMAERLGWDPRDEEGEWVFARIIPERIQAWRESDEIAGRTVMRDGAWLG
jgi:general stress protein 26